jgi:hypothetical protein
MPVKLPACLSLGMAVGHTPSIQKGVRGFQGFEYYEAFRVKQNKLIGGFKFKVFKKKKFKIFAALNEPSFRLSFTSLIMMSVKISQNIKFRQNFRVY